MTLAATIRFLSKEQGGRCEHRRQPYKVFYVIIQASTQNLSELDFTDLAPMKLLSLRFLPPYGTNDTILKWYCPTKTPTGPIPSFPTQ